MELVIAGDAYLPCCESKLEALIRRYAFSSTQDRIALSCGETGPDAFQSLQR